MKPKIIKIINICTLWWAPPSSTTTASHPLLNMYIKKYLWSYICRPVYIIYSRHVNLKRAPIPHSFAYLSLSHPLLRACWHVRTQNLIFNVLLLILPEKDVQHDYYLSWWPLGLKQIYIRVPDYPEWCGLIWRFISIRCWNFR